MLRYNYNLLVDGCLTADITGTVVVKNNDEIDNVGLNLGSVILSIKQRGQDGNHALDAGRVEINTQNFPVLNFKCPYTEDRDEIGYAQHVNYNLREVDLVSPNLVGTIWLGDSEGITIVSHCIVAHIYYNGDFVRVLNLELEN